MLPNPDFYFGGKSTLWEMLRKVETERILDFCCGWKMLKKQDFGCFLEQLLLLAFPIHFAIVREGVGHFREMSAFPNISKVENTLGCVAV
tara:strand:- start:1049 stop:1318 length:270 start_codon:yes stop_codon:yes gene_type:complete